MTETGEVVNSVAPLDNVARLMGLIDRCQNRAHGLPGLGCLYGPAGRGKTTAATYSVNAVNACHIEAMPIGGVKGLLRMIVVELGMKPARTTEDIFLQACEKLARTQRPLIIDEADHILTDRAIEIARRLHDVSQVPLILIGEERLPQKLQHWERVASRILSYVGMENASAKDVDHLARIYAAGLTLGPDLKAALLTASRGSIRHVATSLANVREFAAVSGLTRLGMADWGTRPFHGGEAPIPRDLPTGLRHRRGAAA
jgi:DNA transposition AAA+ family ATPase